jgi:hypothetical protein
VNSHDGIAAMTTEERLRANAERIVRAVGEWREGLAAEMRCGVADVGAGPVSRVRDSEPLDESNFRVLLRDLQSVDQRVSPVRLRHWGFGWVEEIAVPLDNPSVIERVGYWVEQLQAYPAADDMDLAELEAECDGLATDLDAVDDPAGSGAPAASGVRDRVTRLQERLDSLQSHDPPDLSR